MAPPMTAYHRTALPPSGVSHAVSCRLFQVGLVRPSSSSGRRRPHLVTARDNLVQVWQLDHQDRLVHVRTHRLHGEVTSLSVVHTLQSTKDGRDRILCSFHLAKLALLEWSDDDFDLVPVSLHSFEKLPQVAEDRTTLIAHDPQSRMTVLHLPTNSGGDGTLAILPWFTEELDLEGLGMDRQGWEQGGSQIPYAPSHLIPLTALQPPVVASASVTNHQHASNSTASTSAATNAFLPNQAPPIRNVVSLTFLPGFTEPTLALLYAPDYTWSGRLEHLAHNHLVSLVTLSTRSSTGSNELAIGADPTLPSSSSSSSTTVATLISTSSPLPYSLVSIAPVPRSLGIGSVLLTSANGVLLLDIQGGNLVAAATNDWFRRDFPPGRPLPPGLSSTSSSEPEGSSSSSSFVHEKLEGSVIRFLRDRDEDEGDDDADADDDDVNQAELENVALVFCTSGTVLTLEVERTGRSISGLKLDKLDRDGDGDDGSSRCEGGISCAVRVGTGRLFVGGEQADSKLFRVETTTTKTTTTKTTTMTPTPDIRLGNGNQTGLIKNEDAMDEDDEEDIYRDSTRDPKKKTELDVESKQFDASSRLERGDDRSAPSRSSVRLTILDRLDTYGSVRSLAMGLVDDDNSAELVGATGAGRDAGLTVFHRTLPTTLNRSGRLVDDQTVDLVATDGIWNVSIGPRAGELGREDVWVASNDRGTFFYEPAGPGEMYNLVKFERGFRTLYAASMGTGRETVVVLVGSDEIRWFDRDELDRDGGGSGGRRIELTPRSIPTSQSARATCTGSYLAIHVGSDSRLYHYSASSRSLDRIERVPGEGESARLAVSRDADRIGQLIRPLSADKNSARMQIEDDDEDDANDDDDDLYGTKKEAPRAIDRNGTLADESRVDTRYVDNDAVGNDERDWLVQIDENGTLTIHLLPTLLEVFRSQAVSLFPSVISDLPDSTPAPYPASIDPDDLSIDRIQLVPVGSAGSTKLHLVVWNSNGTMAVYESFPCADVRPDLAERTAATDDAAASVPSPRLALRFVKTLVRHVPISTPRRKGGATDLPPPARREIVPFCRVSSSSADDALVGLAGAFVTGEEALWIVKSRQGPARCVEAREKHVYGFSPAAVRGGGEFATVTLANGFQLATVPTSTLVLDHELPLTRVRNDRTYAYVTFDLESGLYVCGTLNRTNFVAFDDDGARVFNESGPGLLEPTNYQSTLELVVPGTWQAIDGYEFRQNEFVCTVKPVSLHSKSRAGGMRDFIAVGTTVYRGEDLSAKGGIYIFEVVKVVAHPSDPRQDHILKLRFFEDTKSIVGNICDLNGYLFLSMGQKLYARAFEQDEVLIAVGFLDLGVHVTSLTSLKNFLLIGDAMQSVALVAFQEDPYKLVFLGRDYRPSRISNANFLVNEGRVSFVTGDDKGVLRMFEYDPSNIASHAGQRLLCRTEYHAGSESIATMLFAKHSVGEDPKQNGILFGGIDGSIYTLVPVRDAVFRRLQTLQTTMTRHVLHFGGLNPRGYRIVKNDTVSRAITKGILDGDLLAKFEYLALDVQTDLASHCGTDVDTVLANLRNLRVYE